MRVLLFGGSLQGLSCGESLKIAGIDVDAFTDNLQVKKSSYFKNVYPYSVEKQADKLFDIINNEGYDVIIPMGDVGVSFLSKNKYQIESTYRTKCACPTQDVLKIVEDKSRFMQFCEEHDIPHPYTFSLNEDNIRNNKKTIKYPALIKPNYSVGARGITKVSSYDELKKTYPVIKEKYGECTLQEFIDNKEYYYNVMLYRNSEGKFLAHTIIKIVRMYPIAAGSSTCCISIEDETLLELCKKCLEKLDWKGMADFDVLQCLDNGEYKIIEINPRVPASLRSAQISGVNFPEIIACDTVGDKAKDVNYVPGKVLRYLGTDLMWFLKCDRRFKTQPNWFAFWGRNIYYQDIFFKDPSTWWTWIVMGLIKLRNRKKRIR